LSLKIRDLPYYAVAPAGIIQVEYHLEQSAGAMWYDLSAVDCNLMVGPEDAMYCRKCLHLPLNSCIKRRKKERKN
jgi:hypothetical protein